MSLDLARTIAPSTAEPEGGHEPDRVAAVGVHDAEAELNSFRSALNRHAIVGFTDRGGIITYVNDLFCEISGYSRNELLGSRHNILNSGHHPRDFFRDMWRTIASGERWHGEICNRAKDGALYWVDTTIVPKFDATGRVVGYISVRYDITRRKQAEQALLEENRRRERVETLLRDIIEALPNGIAAFDEDDRLVLFNSAFRECYPSAGPVIRDGATFREILEYALARGEFASVSPARDSHGAWLETRLSSHRNPGRAFIQELSGDRWLKVHERRSSAGFTVGVRTDVTDLKRAERQIRQQAETDPLTGLFNRRVLVERLTAAMTLRRGDDCTGALVLLDLDGFKAVNDALGHDAGDRLLVEIAARIRGTVRKTDIVSRLGGDEYAVLLTGVGVGNAVRIVRKLLGALEEPVRIGRRSVRVSGSFGIAMFPEGGSKPMEIIKHADMALYKAKADGRATYAVYSAQMRRGARRRNAMVQALHRAIAGDEILVALQPQVRFRDGAHCGFEALVRWKADDGWVSPAELISLAEESGLMLPLGQAILTSTMRTMRRLKTGLLKPGRIAVNVAAAQLRDPGFAKTFLQAAADHGHSEDEFVVEVTESVILDQQSHVVSRTLAALSEAGARIALDDFGTGYASLSHLQRFPISCLKIDRSFVRDLAAADGGGAIAGTIVSLAHSLRMEVVAEGIETKAQFDRLSEMGCDYAQGFLISRPMFADEAEAYLADDVHSRVPSSDEAA